MENNLPEKEEGLKPSPMPRHFDDLAKGLDRIIEKAKPSIDKNIEAMNKQIEKHFGPSGSKGKK